MRKLIASTFASLDGIMQAPGGQEEDPTGGFAHGGWMFAYATDESLDISAAGFDGKNRELVLGRRTYQIFDAYWPYQPDDHPIAKILNAAKKHVASRTLTTLDWNNSTLLGSDVVSAITVLKAQPGPDLQIIGSSNLISDPPGRLADRRIHRVDVPGGAWARQAPLRRDGGPIGPPARSLPALDQRRRDEYLCAGGRYPARNIRGGRAEREDVGPARTDGEWKVVIREG